MILLELISLPIGFGLLFGLLWFCFKLTYILRYILYAIGQFFYKLTH